MKKLRLITLLIVVISTLTTTLYAQPGNAKNPFDDAGINHNGGLDYIIKNRPDLSSKAKILTSVTALADEYSKEEDGDIKMLNSFLESIDFTQSPARLLDRKGLPISVEATNQLRNLFGQIEGFEGDFTKVDQLINLILVWEEKISSLPFTKEEKRILYSSGSIARHSAAYWAAVISNGDDSKWAELIDQYYPGDPIQGKASNGKWKFWQRIKKAWCSIVAYDVVGGSFFGIWGAAGSSAASAIIIGSGILGN